VPRGAAQQAAGEVGHRAVEEEPRRVVGARQLDPECPARRLEDVVFEVVPDEGPQRRLLMSEELVVEIGQETAAPGQDQEPRRPGDLVADFGSGRHEQEIAAAAWPLLPALAIVEAGGAGRLQRQAEDPVRAGDVGEVVRLLIDDEAVELAPEMRAVLLRKLRIGRRTVEIREGASRPAGAGDGVRGHRSSFRLSMARSLHRK